MHGSPIYDVIIVGGGINGCALARLASLNGIRVALVEKNDFGSGVTSRSTRLIHGGLRYLETFRFHLVRESLHDRKVLIREFPGQVAPQAFLIPVYESDARSAWYISIGLMIYSFLTGSTLMPKHRRLSAKEVRKIEPGLDAEGLRAGFIYYDCQAVYPERLSLEMALQAEEAGAVVLNHTAVKEFLLDGSRVVGVKVDGLDGEEEIRAQLVVNAGGAWADQIRRLLPQAKPQDLLTLLNGAHIVLPKFEGAPKHAIYHGARSDGRPFFIIPWRGLYLVGTTETPFAGNPDRMLPTDPDIEYLLKEMNGMFPRSNVTRDAILYAYCGSRPLMRASGSDLNSASREHSIYDHETEDGVAGMLTLVGGKLATARSFAWEALRQAAAKLGYSPPIDPGIPDAIELHEPDKRIATIYGPRSPKLREFMAADPVRANPVAEGCPATRGEIEFAVLREKARTLGDILLRRTGLAFDPDSRPEWVRQVAELAADPLGWSSADIDSAISDYEDELRRSIVAVD